MRIRVFFEGGKTGRNSENEQREARGAFTEFFAKLKLPRQPQPIACGGRRAAFEKFEHALKNPEPDTLPLLLVDSEESLTAPSKWQHLRQRVGDEWSPPPSATENHVFLMVQCMESWLIADKVSLEKFYRGDGFHAKHLSLHPNAELIPKSDVYSALEKATAHCAKGVYSKGRHSWKLLRACDPEEVAKRCPHAKELFDYLRAVCT